MHVIAKKSFANPLGKGRARAYARMWNFRQTNNRDPIIMIHRNGPRHRHGPRALHSVAGAGRKTCSSSDLYSGFEDPSFPSAFHRPARRKPPSSSSSATKDEAFQRLARGVSGRTSRISVPGVRAAAGRRRAFIEPWDRTRIAAYETLNADLVGEDVLAGSAELFFLPTDYGSTAVV